MIIPYEQLNSETLRSVLEEFVSRHGAVQGHEEVTLDQQVDDVMKQLRAGKVVLVYDEEEQTCNVVRREDASGQL
jgi:uncharacterized protein YheU (UPF0270 family)